MPNGINRNAPVHGGARQRIVYTILCLLAGATSAFGGTITAEKINLDGDLRGAATSVTSVTYGNLNDPFSTPFALIGSTQVNLALDGNWLGASPNGYSQDLGIFLGTGDDFSSAFGVAWNSAGTLLGINSTLQFTAVDQFGNFGAIRVSDGASVVGTVNAGGVARLSAGFRVKSLD